MLKEILITIIIFAVFFGLAVIGLEKEAKVRCAELKRQSEVFEEFYYTEAEKEMCF
jgi:Na+/H+-dicarboxylate symporter